MLGQKPELKARLQGIRTFLLCGGLLIASVLMACRSFRSTPSHTIRGPLPVGGLENVYQYSESVYGGSGPYTESNFAELKQLGIDLVVSVDGAIPKVDLAEAEGIRYAHIPIGYDGVSRKAQVQLVKAFEMSESVYVHCHHGKHRGPAAIASLLVGMDVISNEEAVEILKFVGTSDKYHGLYRDVQNARVVHDEELAAVEALPSVADISDFTRTMATIDIHWDHLKMSRDVGWSATTKHPDIDPIHEALMLNEQFRELLRQDIETEYSEKALADLRDFRNYLRDSVEQSGQLESGMRQGANVEYLETQYQALKQSCLNCHETYRN